MNTIDYKKGFVLLVVIGMIGVLAFIGLTFVRLSQQNNNLAHSYLDKVRTSALAHSGFQFALTHLNEAISADETVTTFTVGDGTYARGGDQVLVSTRDRNGQININDGIKAGKLEVGFNRSNGADDHFNQYHPNELDPYPRGQLSTDPNEEDVRSIEDPIKVLTNGPSPSPKEIDVYEKARSALINLRLRRILNAYGDVHRFIDTSYNDKYSNVLDSDYSLAQFKEKEKPLPSPIFTTHTTSSADGRRGFTMSGKQNLDSKNDWENYNNGLGDRIIEMRPHNGYQHVTEVKDIVNNWSQSEGVSLSSEYLKEKTFFNLIQDDLTTVSFEDDRFFRIDDEMRFGDFDASDELDQGSRGNFIPKDLQLDPPDFSHMWLPHSVPLINLNRASFFVKAAIFYAPTNVSYHCEGATTIPPYYYGQSSQIFFEAAHTSSESMIASPSIGVAPPVFVFDNEKSIDMGYVEHAQIVGRNSHLMSLRHAMELAYLYENYNTIYGFGEIKTFNDFEDFLFEIRDRGDDIFSDDDDDDDDEDVPQIRNFRVTYGQVPEEYIGDNQYNFNAGNSYHVSPTNKASEFHNDYLEKTLPHIFSCVRRIPGYLGAPNALQSPYIVLKPVLPAIVSNELNKSPFRKVEDFVWRFTHPKICFNSNGLYFIESQGYILNSEKNILAALKIHSDVKLFETEIFRTQKDFLSITDDNLTDTYDVRIGPEYVNETISASEYLGFVGLNDFEDDLTWDNNEKKRDLYMTGMTPSQDGGYKPQIILNFNPNHPTGQNDGLKNFSSQTINPDPQDPTDDFWINSVHQAQPGAYNSLLGSQFENSFYPMFGNYLDANAVSDLSPFGGARFLSLKHGEFGASQGTHDTSGFSDSLYYRLDPWLDQNGTDNPVGEDLSSGVMTFWFQIPCGYDYPTKVNLAIGRPIEPDSFTRVLASLNMWEKVHFNDITEYTYLRPITLTVGLKKTRKRGLNLFARYDVGGHRYADQINQNHIPYLASETAYDMNIFNNNHKALYDDAIDPQYNTLGFLCLSDLVVYDETNGFFNVIGYKAYRISAHRSTEVSARFGNHKENGPGTWHRGNVYWNFRWTDSEDEMKSDKQLFVEILDTTNKHKVGMSPEPNEFHQSAGHDIAGNPFDDFAYPSDIGISSEDSGMIGFTHTYDSTMILSLGESHARRLISYELKDMDDNTHSTLEGTYVPYWRLNSCLDNIRLYIGPSNPDTRPVPSYYFRSSLIADTIADQEKNAYLAMRYKIMSTEEGFHGDYITQTHEPEWVLKPDIPSQSKLVHIGSRVYYPQFYSIGAASTYSGSYPYVLFQASQNGDIEEAIKWNVDITKNEQEYSFKDIKVNNDFRLHFKYCAHKPYLDGNPHNRGLNGQPAPLIYTEIQMTSSPKQFTNIPYIKEASIRYQPPTGAQFLNWNEKYFITPFEKSFTEDEIIDLDQPKEEEKSDDTGGISGP